jgi:hypothetical protein
MESARVKWNREFFLACERLACERLACERLACERLACERLACERLACERLASQKKNPGFHLTGEKLQAILDCVQDNSTRQQKEISDV